MLLTVDVGNTQTHIGAWNGEQLVEHWRFATVRESTADELGAALRNLLELRGVGLAELEASIVSSTVPQLVPEWVEMGQRYLGHDPAVVGPGLKTGMPIRIDNPRELGADRIVNAVSAYAELGGPCVAIDFGTAVTYDVVSAAGEYLGGIISPGVGISLDALSEHGAKLPKIDLVEPRSLIGKSTVDAIRAGIVFGYAGQVEGVVRRLRAELGAEAPAVATGGMARHIVPYCERGTIERIDDFLTLKGMRLLHERSLG